jgi:hypothetical protein
MVFLGNLEEAAAAGAISPPVKGTTVAISGLNITEIL